MKKFLSFIACIVIGVGLFIGSCFMFAALPDGFTSLKAEFQKGYYLHLGLGIGMLLSSIGMVFFSIASFFSNKVKIKNNE